MTKYPTSVLVAMVMLVKGVSTLDLGKFRTPVHLIYAPGNKVVSARAIVKTFTAIGTDLKELVPFTRSQPTCSRRGTLLPRLHRRGGSADPCIYQLTLVLPCIQTHLAKLEYRLKPLSAPQRTIKP
jgi:hypothetical protein